MEKSVDNTLPVEIVLASNERYFVGLLVTASSIARNAGDRAPLSFNILDGGLSEQSKNELCRVLKELRPTVRIRFLSVDLSRFEGLPTMSGSSMAYARILLPRLLPDIDFVIYCDVDFLWFADIVDLWQMRDPCCAIQSTRETFPKTLAVERKWADDHWVKFPADGYFCSGLCLFNLKALRERSLDFAVLDFLSRHRDVAYHDQSALNFLLAESDSRIGWLPRRWQVFTHDVTDDDTADDFVLHFAGNTPWAPVSVLTDAEMLWFEELARARGVSLWRALRMIHRPLRIIRGRGVFKLATLNRLTLTACRGLLRRAGRFQSAALLRPVKIPPKKRL